MMTARLCLPAALLAVAACSQSNEEAPAPSPSLTTQAAPTQAADGTDLAAGQWAIEETAGGASAAFGPAGREPLLVIVCDRAARTVSLRRPAASAPATYRIEVPGQKADLRMASASDGRGVSAAIDPRQPIFAGWSSPAAVIRVTAPGEPALNVPGHAGIGRVIAACG